jgi:asparagine synthase (glutamine-hydrolysing)
MAALVCGISGVIGASGSSRERIVARQIELLRHRGPDAEGTFAKDCATLAQNRLAIIDLVSGDPPITNEDGQVGAVLNGEIYNFRRLREQLERSGHRFSSHGDTEVLVHLAEEDGAVELARRLDGMFAFAVWDDRRQRVILGRDRLGKKPLYYTRTQGGELVFASEIKALFVHPEVEAAVDEDALPAYLTFGYVPCPRTFFQGVRSVPPGHVLSFAPGGDPRLERYWEAPLAGRNGAHRSELSLGAAAAQVRARLEQAVERRLLSDVPLGAFLSGGIDSSAITAIAATRVDHRLATFTMGFEDEEGFDERPYARLVARHCGTDHHEFVVRPDAAELVERLVWHHDQPFGDSSAVPTYLLSQATRGGVTVALSGDGGDELFAGYERFAGGMLAERYQRIPAPIQRLVAAGLAAAPQGGPRSRVQVARRFASAASQGLPQAYLSWVSFVSRSDLSRLLGSKADGAGAEYEGTWAESAGAPVLDRLLNLNLRTYLLDDLLPKADRMSMAHGLEVRSPFLDLELLEHATALPPRLKVRGPVLKRVLKEAVRDLLPAETLGRRKRGFGIPLDRWFRDDLRGYVSDTLAAPDARVGHFVRAEAVRELLQEHWSGRRNLGHTLWTLLTLEVFLRERLG